MAKLKKYETHQKKVVPKPKKPLPSGIACTEDWCDGEMMINQPDENHPELPLKRAICGKCGWRGWV
jgi:hypothetical protein